MKEIKKIIAAYDRVDWEQEGAALGTVVKVEGSSYRRIGARIFVQSSGEWVGGISGGCLEGDALRQAQKAINSNTASIVVYDTREDDPHQIGVGLGCNGRIEVLFTPIDPADKYNQIEYLKRIVDDREPNLLIQVIATWQAQLVGGFYARQDLPMLATALDLDGEALEREAAMAYRKRKSKAFKMLSKSGETVELVAEVIHPKIKLICVGDNYDVVAMLEVTKALDWEVHIAGRRRKLTKAMCERAFAVHELAQVGELEMDAYTALVLMSHDFKTDMSILRQVLDRDIPYLGLLGPRKRMEKMQGKLAAEGRGVHLAELSHVHGPVGLDIGAETPEEIAVSIVGEIIATIRDRAGGRLRLRQGKIYE